MDREETFFHAAIEIEDPAQRAAYLDGACQGDPALRKRLENLLAKSAAAEALFGTVDPPEGDAATLLLKDDPLSEGPGTVIGRYKLLEEIGHGGMGVVYMAQQEEPVRRRVALKIIKLGMDTRQVVARFEAERQALALMDHPHIAKVLDAGATDTGRPYFVMELVRGIPITEFCDKRNLTTRERLELFVPICQAIQHAHQKGIIHRDIKPTNILVTFNDGVAHPMVIDFGIAKATHQRLTEKTLFTQFSQLIGTPAYMSPEQAEMSRLDVDTRTDIYSLGVLLYELLTGTTPFSERRLRSLGYAEMQRVIAEEEPPRPSTRLSTLTDVQKTELVKRHKANLRSMSLLFRQELDWVVMKAMEKDRNRRYETANGLAMDVKRYLEGRALEAAPPTWGYQFYKLARKHKKSVAVAALIAVILAGAAVFSSWQAIRATKAEHLAEDRLEETLREKAATDAINEWLQKEVVELGASWGTPGGERTAEIKLREVLVMAAERLPRYFNDRPLTEADLRYSIGISLHSGGRSEAIVNLRRCYELRREHLGPDNRGTVHAQALFAWYSIWRALNDPARGPEAPQEATALLEDAYQRAMRIGDSLLLTYCANHLGLAHLNQDSPERPIHLGPASHWFARSVELAGPLDEGESPTLTWETIERLNAHETHSWVLWRNGSHARSAKLSQQIWQAQIRMRTSQSGGMRPDARFARLHPAMARLESQWYRNDARAEELLLQSLPMVHRLVGSAHPTDIVVNALFDFYRRGNRFPDALNLARTELAGAVPQLGLEPRFPNALGEMAIAVPGIQADWHGVIEELDRQEDLGLSRTSDADIPRRLLMLHLLGREDEYRDARRHLWRQLRSDPITPELARSPLNTISLLALPCPDDEVIRLIELADSSVQRADTNVWWRPLRTVLMGMRAYRNGEYARAVDILSSPAYSCPWLPDQSMAGYALAMAKHQKGQAQESRRTLDHANQFLDGVVRRGKFDPMVFGTYRRGKLGSGRFFWTEFAILLALRQEAERLVYGRTASAWPTPQQMAVNRRHWEPIDKLLDDAAWLARQRRYREAAQRYEEARGHPHFSMEAADFDRDALWEMLMTHVMLDEPEAVERLSRSVSPDDRYVAPALLALTLQLTNALPATLQGMVSTSVATFRLEERWTAGVFMAAWWDKLALALYWYRQGEFAKAVEPLQDLAAEPYVHFSTAGTAYLALVQHRLGNHARGRELLEKARTAYRQIYIEPWPDLYQPFWVWAAMVEQAVREALQVIEPSRSQPDDVVAQN